jgi:hypothetical protein
VKSGSENRVMLLLDGEKYIRLATDKKAFGQEDTEKFFKSLKFGSDQEAGR